MTIIGIQGAAPGDAEVRFFSDVGKRNVTTKNGLGHEMGTCSMKFFGEKVLGGKMNLSPSEDRGMSSG